MLTDSFNRSSLNEIWTKYASNPIITGDFGDPFVWYESGTYYVFVRNQVTGNIVVFTSTDRNSWSGPTTMLSPGGSGAWDEYSIEGPYVVKVGLTYYLFFGGNQNVGGSGTTWKIGYATASAINGPYTKYGSNPVISRGGYGCNDNAVFYDATQSPPWQLICTVGNIGNKDDVTDGNFGRFTAASPDGTWTDQGDVIGSLPGQDLSLTLDDKILVMPYTPVGAASVIQAVSKDKGVNWNAALAGALISKGGGGAWDDVAIYAPHIIQPTGSDWFMVYQGIDGGVSQIGYATAPGLHRWFPTAADAFEVITYLHTLTPAPLAWNCLRSEYPFLPPYTFLSDFYVESQADGGIMTLGFHVAQSSGLYYLVLINAAAGRIYTYSGSSPTDTATLLNTSSVFTINQATWYSIRVIVTATGFSVDFYDGTWHTGVLTETGLSLTYTRTGFVCYSPTGNLSRFRNFQIQVDEAPVTTPPPRGMMMGVGR